MREDAGPRDPVAQSRIRPAEPGDVAEMDAMIRELAAYEREPDAVQASPADLHEALFRTGAHTHALVAEISDPQGAWSVAGSAVWFLTYSTWTGRAGIWLEDLYVRPHARGRGLGTGLLAALAAECLHSGYRRLDFSVLDWNADAQRVYRAAGARPMEDWSTWRIEGAALEALGQRSPAPPATAPRVPPTRDDGQRGGSSGPLPRSPGGAA